MSAVFHYPLHRTHESRAGFTLETAPVEFWQWLESMRDLGDAGGDSDLFELWKERGSGW